MDTIPDSAWLNLLINALQNSQLALLQLLHVLGLTGTVHGQPAWPWALRLSGENLLIDLGQARRLGQTVLLLAVALLALLLALLWRRRRYPLLALALLLVLVAPWPDPKVVLVPATATSFHAPPASFSAQAIGRGARVYAQLCVSCHGSDGQGNGPQVAQLAVWPPTFAGPLLWRRADGDLLWHVLNGTHDRKGAATMPGFASQLSDDDAWALIDFMKALGAGQALHKAGVWPQPVRLPEMEVHCSGQPVRSLASWRGQRLRIVAGTEPLPPEDPRLVTVRLAPASWQATAQDDGCSTTSATAWNALALIAGTPDLAGMQMVADRDGWLRARGEPGKAAWTADDLLCRTETGTGGKPPSSGDGLGALIALMDADKVRFTKGGFVH